MNYLTSFEGKTLFNKLWPLLDLRAELDLMLTNHCLTAIICKTEYIFKVFSAFQFQLKKFLYCYFTFQLDMLRNIHWHVYITC